MNKIQTYHEALDYLCTFIPVEKQYKYPGDFGLRRTYYFLKLLGEPQNHLKIIHIAGTSGKSSTAFFTSHILHSSGFKVGLHVSPHLLDIRERFQINNKLLDEKKFLHYVNLLIPLIKRMKKTKFGLPTYFEITVVLAYFIFYSEKVDYAVIETGLGGLLDATNVVERHDVINIITQIGHDHTEILGKTLDKITLQKTGIIKKNNCVITFGQRKKVLKIIRDESAKQEAKLYVIGKGSVRNIQLFPNPNFSFKFLNTEMKDITLRMLGSFQIQNCSLALAASVVLAKRDGFIQDIEKIKGLLSTVCYQGRLEKLKVKKCTVILDGAHNPQKMNALIVNLKKYFPNQKFAFLLGFKSGKDIRNILKCILPVAEKIIVTTFFNQTKFQGYKISAQKTDRITKTLTSYGFNKFIVCKIPGSALGKLLRGRKTVKVITGSLYLLSEIYPKIQV
ncbi:MAG: Mur ligase family protein [bacterium]|nr:Mur ligase family protein [bacterium]